mmetsp:Transcript_13014/g.30005  ORF Transcript_13014/g.30005 Transcript_13014/m.30005 type:complete len:204 (-) Transcript_13014:993-1604(-)
MISRHSRNSRTQSSGPMYSSIFAEWIESFDASVNRPPLPAYHSIDANTNSLASPLYAANLSFSVCVSLLVQRSRRASSTMSWTSARPLDAGRNRVFFGLGWMRHWPKNVLYMESGQRAALATVWSMFIPPISLLLRRMNPSSSPTSGSPLYHVGWNTTSHAFSKNSQNCPWVLTSEYPAKNDRMELLTGKVLAGSFCSTCTAR